jgi:cell division protein FtsZ
VVAEIARDIGALTVGVVTKPFQFEGPRRLRLAEEGIVALKQNVDTSIVIPNDRLLSAVERRARLEEAFRMADDVLRQGVQGVSDIITIPGLINVDFADIKAIMSRAGTAIMGIGSAAGDNRAAEAASMAISSPLLETSIEGARGVLLNVTAGNDLTLDELYEASNVVSRAADTEDAFIIMGCVIDEELGDQVRVTVLATGFPGQGSPGSLFNAEPAQQQRPMRGGGSVAPQPHSHSTAHQAHTPGPAASQTGPAGAQNQNDLDIPPFLRKTGGR